jgi:hypothetical protein
MINILRMSNDLTSFHALLSLQTKQIYKESMLATQDNKDKNMPFHQTLLMKLI